MFIATIRALGFLSRVPISSQHFDEAHRPSDDAHAYPLAGIAISLPAALIISGAAFYPTASLLFAALAVFSTVVITGALHEDGLADVADGFFATKDRARMLKIMRDPHLGTFGTLALIFSIVLRVACLSIVIEQTGPLAAALLFMGVEAVSRSAMVWHWYALPNARSGGKADQAGRPDEKQVRLGVAIGSGTFIITGLTAQIHLLTVVITVTLAACAAFVFKSYCSTKLDGHTGDTIGTTQQIVVVTVLSVLAILGTTPT
ncbi:MAG: adenosylcobinamide-GDP ribazoletransferase [Pseudomonadota bacterium]